MREYNMGDLVIKDCAINKIVTSENYNYTFNKETGYFVRWGKSFDVDPEYAPAPEIADICITSKCDHGCEFCYKGNTSHGHNMSFEDFKTIFHKLPKTLTQIAFGVDAYGTANPDMLKMMRYSRYNGVIPNVTIAKIDEQMAENLANVCGAVAVSRYENKLDCYDSIKLLHKYGLKQNNIHLLVAEETEHWVWETFNDYLNGEIKGLNAIVLLGLKQKGRGTHYNTLSQEKYSKIINYALDNKIPIGADSCSGPKLVKSVLHRDNYDEIYQMVDPCESTLFSIFIDENCNFYPCSFMPKTEGWENGINMLTVNDFDKDIWNHPLTVNFRNKLIMSWLSYVSSI